MGRGCTVTTIDIPAEQLGLFDTPIVTPPMIRGATLAQRWEAFHRLNPQVFAAIERQALRLAAQGEKRIGVKAIAEDLRRGRLATTGDDWRINNSWPAFYARLLVAKHPRLEGVIEMRRAVADEVPA